MKEYLESQVRDINSLTKNTFTSLRAEKNLKDKAHTIEFQRKYNDDYLTVDFDVIGFSYELISEGNYLCTYNLKKVSLNDKYNEISVVQEKPEMLSAFILMSKAHMAKSADTLNLMKLARKKNNSVEVLSIDPRTCVLFFLEKYTF